jgi:hypothetical protein
VTQSGEAEEARKRATATYKTDRAESPDTDDVALLDARVDDTMIRGDAEGKA